MWIKPLHFTSALLLILSAVSVGVAAQENDWRTTDDTRSVPLPPRDTSGDAIVVIEGGTLIDGLGARRLKMLL